MTGFFLLLSTACPCAISPQQPSVTPFKITVWSCSVKLFNLSETWRYRLLLLPSPVPTCPTLPLPIPASTAGPSLQQFHWELALSHLHAAWNKLDGEDFMAAFSFSFPKKLERIATVFLSMDKIQFWIHQNYSPCDRTEFSPKQLLLTLDSVRCIMTWHLHIKMNYTCLTC